MLAKFVEHPGSDNATLVRMVLVPSVMQMLGATAWVMPRWFDRLLPKSKDTSE